MKIVDVNVIVGPQPFPTRYRKAKELVQFMDDYRITTAVVCHSAAKMIPWQFNAEISHIADESGGRIQACHILDPMLAEKSEPGEGTLMERLMINRPAAIRILPTSQRFPLNTFFCDHVLGPINEIGLPLLLDSTEITNFADIPSLACDFPDIPIVLLRQHHNLCRIFTPFLTKLKNVYIDVNIMIDTGYLEELVHKNCSSEKLLLGSGLPHHVPAGGLSIVLYSNIDDLDKQNILHANWERLQGGIRYDYQG